MLPEQEDMFRADLSRRGLGLGEGVRLSRVIPAAAADVWTAISSPGQLNKHHPYCRRNPVICSPGARARDGGEYYSGLHFERDFMAETAP